MNRRTKGIRIFALLLALLLAVSMLAGCAGNSGSSSQQGSTVSAAAKNITVKVVHKDGSEKEFAIAAEGETLREALEQEKLVEGEEGEYGLFVKTVDGETVDDGNQEWWCLTKGGEQVNTGVDGVKIADGDVYELTLTVGY